MRSNEVIAVATFLYLAIVQGVRQTPAGAGTAPQRRSIIIGLGLLILTAVPAMVLLTILFRR